MGGSESQSLVLSRRKERQNVFHECPSCVGFLPLRERLLEYIESSCPELQ